MDKNYTELSLKGHKVYKGKISTASKVPIKSYEDFVIWYTPGVAAPCLKIADTTSEIYEYTNKGNFVAVVSDGTRVLGLGKIGPHAALPVMEGKALLFKYLGDVDAFPICLNTHDAEEIIQAVKWMTPTFGGINLEDIESPKCFYLYERLSTELNVPVFHDDQQGTAIVTLAALINAMKLVGKRIHQSKITIIGAGTAAISTVKHFIAFGVNAGNILMVNRGGILHSQRKDLNPWQAELARITNKDNEIGDANDAIKDADTVIGFSVPGTITKDMIRSMADDPIVFALANPIPEIIPSQALEAGAKIAASGRSDYPNQVNNSLCFPALFRGVLDVRAKKINAEMMQAATHEIARYAEEKGLRTEYIIPAMDETDMYTREAVAVANAAMKSGVARVKVNLKELSESIENRILKSRLLSKELHRLDRIELKFHALKAKSLYRERENEQQ